ncbi:MAG TPA: hypothetical protein VFV73_25835 [Streptosporangiaceae bacterium]|nr:hypothetical protein [Streptosporangiaceae bacterium]
MRVDRFVGSGQHGGGAGWLVEPRNSMHEVDERAPHEQRMAAREMRERVERASRDPRRRRDCAGR